MFRFRTTLRKPVSILLVLAGLIVVAGLVIDRDADELTVQTAIGQTNETFQKSDDFQYLERANQAFINLVAQTRPSVVQITTKTKRNSDWIPQRERMSPEQEEQFRRFFGEDFFRRFFEERTPPEYEDEPEPATGIGSGVIVSDDGYILTNNHVIEGTDEIEVTLANGREYPAELIGRDAAGPGVSGTDLALLKIDAEGLPALPFGNSDALEVGEWVIAIGTPLNLSQTVTRGIVSAKGRDRFSSIKYGNFIQTDAPINQGNSGGALINIRGELVGINTLIATSGFASGNIGIGFAIPSNIAQQLMPQLIANGEIVRGWLGIQMRSVDYDLAEKLKLDTPRGALVVAVGRNSPAEKAGIQRGDIILEFDEQTIRDSSHLMHSVGAASVGTSVVVKVLRKEQEKRLTVELEKRTEEAMASLAVPAVSSPVESQKTEVFAGIHVQNLTPELARRYGYENETGVIVVKVDPGSPASRKGIRRGYLIQEMDYTAIKNLEDYEAIFQSLKESKEKLAILYVKGPNQRGNYLTLKIDYSDR